MAKHALFYVFFGFIFVMIPCRCMGDMAVYYYHPKPYGSEAFYNPLNIFAGYSLDTVQLRENFGTHHFDKQWDTVIHNLTHPGQAIREEGGTRAFINRQIFPISGEDAQERYAAVPNYFLHLLGGGMVYRKDAEYFQAKGYTYPRILSATLAMTAEILQEAIEKKSTTEDDEVADVLIFRPIGILLFSSDAVSGFVDTHLSPAIWPHLLVYDIHEEIFLNAGMNYVARPNWFGRDSVRFFSFFGMNNLFGLSHKTGEETALSWGMGLATSRVDFSRDIPAEFRFSGGVFYDKNNSLLWSVIFNGTENLKLRLNVYPTGSFPWNRLGFFAGLTDDRALALGVTMNFPVGFGVSM